MAFVYPQATAQTKPLALETIYNGAGFASEVRHAETGLSYWKVEARALDGQLVRGSLGGVITVNQGYSADGMGRLSRINVISGVNQPMPAVGTTGLLDQSFGFDSIGNLLNRTLNAPAGAGIARNEAETFIYDLLDRLTRSYNTNGGTALAGQGYEGYDAAGNLAIKGGTDAAGANGLRMGFASGTNALCAIGASTACARVVNDTPILGATPAGQVTYDSSGNIRRYTRPNSTQAPNVPGADGSTLNLLNYTAFNLPLAITRSVGGNPNLTAASAEFFYDAGYQRVRQKKYTGDIAPANLLSEIIYVVPGGFEVTRNAAGQVTQSTATISGPDGSVATVTTNYDPLTGAPLLSGTDVRGVSFGSGINTTSQISGANTITKLLLKDHLGSMVAEVTITGTLNVSGQLSAVSVVAEGVVVHGFGPWGNARNAASPLNGDSRGFTGHEHLAELGLIHMNGRIYDPVIGPFLQADPIIQAPHNAQSYNRYSYVMNNPLSFTDPSGFSRWTRFRDTYLKPAIAIAVALFIGGFDFTLFLNGGGFSWAAGANGFVGAIAGGFAAGGIQGGNIQSALQGAFSAALFYGAGGFGVEGGFERVVAHAAASCASAAAAGGSCGRGAASAGFAAFAGPRLGAALGGSETAHFVASAISGGAASRIGGGSFLNGAMTAVYGYLFNRTFHEAAQAANAAEGCTKPTQSCANAHRHAQQMRTEMLKNEAVQPVMVEDWLVPGLRVLVSAVGRMFPSIANSGSALPGREIANFIGEPAAIQLGEGTTLYGIRQEGSRSVWWTRTRPQGELQWRMDQAVLPNWNAATHIEVLTIPKGFALNGFEGAARSQGWLLGGGNQVYIPNVPSNWISRSLWN